MRLTNLLHDCYNAYIHKKIGLIQKKYRPKSALNIVARGENCFRMRLEITRLAVLGEGRK